MTTFVTPHSTEWHRAVAEANTVLLVEVGSTLHGVTVSDQDDVDEMGICIEPAEVILGVTHAGSPRFEQYEFRTQPVGARSGPGDVDHVVYGLRKYTRLVAAGNPTVMMPLFAPPDMIRTVRWPGHDLREHREMFLSRQAGYRFKGYLDRQRSHLDGTLAARVHRPELIEKYGFDSKFAYHALRLAMQGIELMQSHTITLPMPANAVGYLHGVRTGTHTLEQVLSELDSLTSDLVRATLHAELPEWPDYEVINAWLAATYRGWWSSD